MTTTTTKPSKISAAAAGQAEAMDSRYHLAAGMRRQINKVFPTHWSFMLGEIALYSFVILLISGVFLTLFFDPSMAHVVYQGAYQPLRGVTMSRAYETTLNISFEVRGGLFVRQIHHWAALMFAASIIVHLARIFFTGASVARVKRTGSSAACCSSWRCSKASSVTPSPTTCSRHRPPRRLRWYHDEYPDRRYLDALADLRRRLPR